MGNGWKTMAERKGEERRTGAAEQRRTGAAPTEELVRQSHPWGVHQG